MVLVVTLALDTIARHTWNTVSPVRCSRCGRPDVVFCQVCQRKLTPQVHYPTLAIRRALFDVPVIAGTHYTGVVRSVIADYKDRGVVGLGAFLVGPLRAAVSRLSHDVLLDGAMVVCVPHSTSGWIKRGRNPTRDLVKRAGWAAALAPARALRAPRHASRISAVSTQKNRSRRERLASPPTFVGGEQLAGRRVVLIDDVLTTGTSLESAARAISRSGGVVVGAVVVAATPSWGE